MTLSFRCEQGFPTVVNAIDIFILRVVIIVVVILIVFIIVMI